MIFRTPYRLAIVAGLLLVGGVAGLLALRSSVERALREPPPDLKPLRLVPFPAPATPIPTWGGADVEGVAQGPGGLLTAGGFGVQEGGRDISPGLPTLRASALARWRGRAVVGLGAGGFYIRRGESWEEARSGWGTLHVRTLVETPAGELLVGAREGLFRAAWGGAVLERLTARPVRAIAAAPGLLLAGGEQGLYRVEPGQARLVATPDPWVESLAIENDRVLVVTAAGLARGPLSGPLEPVPGGDAIVSGVAHQGSFWAASAPPALAVPRLRERLGDEPLPAPARRLFSDGGTLFADTDAGLLRRAGSGWEAARPRDPALLPGSAHVGALAAFGSRLVVGLFDGGLATADPARVAWRMVPGSAAWGVNALLPAGGALYVASLRGAARFDGVRLAPLEGPGPAFSLAATEEGVAIGYGQGVLLPGRRLLSAFHGLPGNQAVALLSGPSLFVGTPSGLGAVESRRVAWRVAAGEGKLPHSWVTALALSGNALYVGTYGGGVARRTPGGGWEPFVETEGLKVNPGCLVEAGGRVYAGTDGRGLYRLSFDRRVFEKLDLPLPSPRVTALLPSAEGLYVGTDEGLARMPRP